MHTCYLIYMTCSQIYSYSYADLAIGQVGTLPRTLGLDISEYDSGQSGS